MKETVLLLLCAVALAHSYDRNSQRCNCDPSEAQQICESHYGLEDVLIAHENCDKFYQCANGKPVAYRCPDNLLYDPVAERCEWPHKVDCGDRPISEGGDKDDSHPDDSDSGNVDENWTCNCDPAEAPAICAVEGSNEVLVAHENCDKYYMCAEGLPVAFCCPPSLLYNPYKEQCDWAHNVDCGDRVISESDNCAGDDNDDNNNGTCNCNPEEAPAICAAPGSDGVLVAHQNCDKYYICNHGIPEVVSCPDNLLFNPYINRCDWARDVDCGDRIVPETDCAACNDNNDTDCDGTEISSSTQAPVSFPTSRPVNEGTCNCRPDEAPSICAADGSDGILVAHENCNQFYTCDHGKPVAMYCFENLLYNPYTEKCDWPENVDCGDRVIPDPSQTPTPGPSTTSTQSPGGGTCNCRPEEAPSICAVDGSDGILVAHENCNQFYTCSYGKPVAMYCFGNLLYNPYTEQCDWPENVDCGDRVIPDPDQTPTPGPSTTTTQSPGGGTCNCRPEEAPSICAADGSDGILVAHENCNQFYTCDHGKPVAMYCFGNLLYNPYTEQCDWPENVDCGDRYTPDPSQTPTPGPTSTSTQSPTPGPSSTSTQSPTPGPTTTSTQSPTPGPTTTSTQSPGGGNCNPGEAPTICAADDSEGVLVAHENCNQYYMCSGGKPVALSCPGNLLFNPNKDQCDWPENVDCGDRVIPDPDQTPTPGPSTTTTQSPGGGTCNCRPEEAPSICAADGSDGILVAHENCNQFYTCDHGKPVAMYCFGNLLYNPYTEQCDWPENVDCGDRNTPDPSQTPTPGPSSTSTQTPTPGPSSTSTQSPTSGPSSTSTQSPTPGPTTTSTQSPGGGNCNPSEAPTICAADDSEGVLVAHENCNQYYMCSGGKPVALSCPGNLLFNPNKDQCDWPENVDCGDRVIPDPDQTPTPGPSTTTTQSPGGGTCNCRPEEAPSICAADGSDGNLVAHENCNQFYTCDHGKPVAMYCFGNLLYNPYTEQCDWPENVDCGDRYTPDPSQTPTPGPSSTSTQTPSPGPSSTSTQSPTSGPSSTSTQSPTPGPSSTSTQSPGGGNCNPGEAPTICAADDSEGVLVAHENCNQYYMCSGGKPVALSCPGNLLFNPNKDQCDWPENVDCGDRVIPDPDQTPTPGSSTTTTQSPGGGTCNCRPEEAPSICAADGSDGILVAHENCNQFYTCDHGKPVAMYCFGNLLYNPYTEQCDWPENVDCGDRVIPGPSQTPTPGPSSTTTSTQTPTPGPSSTSTQSPTSGPSSTSTQSPTPGPSSTSTQSPGGGNCNPGEAPTICAADDSEGVLVAHENCNQYYMCSGGKPVALSCPGNLLFNPNKDQCDWPENVDCGDRVIPDPDQTPTPGPSTTTTQSPGGGTCNCRPEEAPSICAADGSDGILVAHENCNQFYTCDHGKPVAMYCFGNLLYNPYTEQCDWPENVDCGDRFIPDPSQTSTPGPSSTSTQSPTSGPSSTSTQSPTPGPTTTTTQSPGGGNCNPGEAPTICAADDSEGVLVAHENCNQYYMCSGGKPVALSCPGNLLFNPNKDQCDWPENVDCGDRVIPDPDQTPTPGSSTTTTQSPGGGTCNCRPEEAPSICAADGSDGILVAHENCNQFYTCDHGKPVAMYCFGNLLYNPYTEQCDWPENVDCGDRVIPGPSQTPTPGPSSTSTQSSTPGPTTTSTQSPTPGPTTTTTQSPTPVPTTTTTTTTQSPTPGPTTTTTTTTQSPTPGPTTTTTTTTQSPTPGPTTTSTQSPTVAPSPEPEDSDSSDIDDLPNPDDDVSSSDDCSDGQNDNSCNCDPDQAPSICAGANSNGIHIAHENCNQFYICSSGRPIAFRCPSNLLYNPFIPGCDWPENVDCGDRIIPDPDDTTEGPQPTEPDDNIDGPGPCNHCNPEEAPAICASENSTGILIAHQNCNQYYVCEHGRPVTFSCSPPLVYNVYSKQCDWQFNVDCGDRVIVDCDDDGGDDSGDNNNNEVYDDPSQAPAICAGLGSDGILVAHEYCDQYYICDGSLPLPRPCNGGLLFNPQNQQCDWPSNVDCGNRIIPDDCACNPRNAPKLCSWPNSEGKLIAHDNCNQYYVCSNGVPVAQTCPSNLFYNIDSELCDWPHKVSCANRQLPYSSLNKHWQSRQFLRT